MGATRDIGEWAATVSYEDVPARIHPKTKAQVLSVIGAIHAGRHSEAAQAAFEVARSWGGPEECTVFAWGEKLPHHSAMFANCCASVAFDFDDYLFAGHTGHSAVCASLAYGEITGASGRDVLAAMTVANEVGGRLGASLLFGPHNGQMWAYIHLIESACAAGRLLGLDAGRMTHAIGIAFTQPVYPLMPAFMGPDSKLLIPASPTVEGARAAELAARGWTGAPEILEDKQGFLRKYNENNLGWMLSGLGEAWVSDSLTYKVVPGCAYIDTAVDALQDILRERPLRAQDVEDVHVRCGMFTYGMETFANMYRSAERLAPISINFSVALSYGLLLTDGLEPRYLSHKHLDANREAIEAVAAKVRLEHDTEMDRRAAAAAESGGFSLRSLLSGAPQSQDFPAMSDRLKEVAAGAEPPPRSLRGVSFEGYKMAFPAEVTVRTADGATFTTSQEIPLGGSGRPWDETDALVREKLLANFAGDRSRAEAAIAAVDRMEELDDIRELTSLLEA
jgi:2-methylcitrate dehydratase PrpD